MYSESKKVLVDLLDEDGGQASGGSLRCSVSLAFPSPVQQPSLFSANTFFSALTCKRAEENEGVFKGQTSSSLSQKKKFLSENC